MRVLRVCVSTISLQHEVQNSIFRVDLVFQVSKICSMVSKLCVQTKNAFAAADPNHVLIKSESMVESEGFATVKPGSTQNCDFILSHATLVSRALL